MFVFFLQEEDGLRDLTGTGVQTCALPICFAVHISHVQAAIRRIGKLYRTKPVIGAGDKFTLLFTLGSAGNRLHPVIVQTLAMNQIAPCISNESVSEEIQIGRASCRERV